MPRATKIETGTDLVTCRTLGDGWYAGTVGGFAYEAKVYAEHADHPSFELGRSRISKLHLRVARLPIEGYVALRGREVFSFDRGLDRAATSDDAQQAVDLLCERLADAIYGKARA